jgi:hypothetical protein
MARKGARRMGAAQGPGTRIKGVRFEALLSQSRKFVDIHDLKHRGKLTLLDVPAIIELRELADQLLEVMESGG